LTDGSEHYLDIYDNVGRSGTEYRRVRIGNPVANTNTGAAPVHNTQPTNQAGTMQDLEDDLPF